MMNRKSTRAAKLAAMLLMLTVSARATSQSNEAQSSQVYESKDGFYKVELYEGDQTTEGSAKLIKGDHFILADYVVEDGLVSFNPTLFSEFRQPFKLSHDGKTLVSFDNRIKMQLKVQTPSNPSAPLDFTCGSSQSNGIHGLIVNVREIPRSHCPYPWTRYTYSDGYTCDIREACH
jgi:hypothetical protein